MSIQTFAEFMEGRFAKQIASHTILDGSTGDFAEYPAELDQRLAGALRSSGVDRLYSHQVEAFDSIRRNRDTVLITRTASGKTLSFLLPILHEYLQADAPCGVALLYPTKALSRDQEGMLGRLLDAAGADLRLGTFGVGSGIGVRFPPGELKSEAFVSGNASVQII